MTSRNREDSSKTSDKSDDIRNLRADMGRLSADFHAIENDASEKASYLKGLYMGLLFGIVGNLIVSYWIDIFHYLVMERSDLSTLFSIVILLTSILVVVGMIRSYKKHIRELDKIRKEASELISKLEEAAMILERIER